MAPRQSVLITSDVLRLMTPESLRLHTGSDEFCAVADLTSAYMIQSLQKPRSRDPIADPILCPRNREGAGVTRLNCHDSA